MNDKAQERIRIRAYYLSTNHTDDSHRDTLSFWLQAEREEAFIGTLPGTVRWPYAVIDQNVLRDSTLLASVSEPLLLPDVALAELIKGDSWRYVAERSLAVIALSPDKVYIARPLSEIRSEEKTTGSLAQDIVESEVTDKFRKLLKLFQADPKKALNSIVSSVPSARAVAADQYFEATSNKLTVTKLCEAWKEDLTASDLKQLRGNAGEQTLHRLLSDSQIRPTLYRMLENSGYSQTNAKDLTWYPSFTSVWNMAYITLALMWLKEGGINSANEDKLTNDLVDLEYVVMGFFCAKYVSKEVRMNTIYGILRDALDAVWSSNVEQLIEQIEI